MISFFLLSLFQKYSNQKEPHTVPKKIEEKVRSLCSQVNVQGCGIERDCDDELF